MATFFFDQKVGFWVNVDLNGSLYGDVRRSGNTVYLENMTFDMYPKGSAWGTDTFTLWVNGTGTSFSVTGGSIPAGTPVNSTSFGVSASQTSATINWSTSDGIGGSFVVTFPSGVAPPHNLRCSNVICGTRSFTATVSLSDWGTGGSSSQRYRELQCWTYSSSGLVTPRRYQAQYGNSLSGVITVDNNSSGDLNIQPNTRYILGVYAANGADNTGSQRVGEYTTLCEAPTALHLNNQVYAPYNKVTATMEYTVPEDGGRYNKTLYYSLDGTNWTSTGVVITSGAQTTGTFDILLKAGQIHTVYLRTTTDVGNSSYITATVEAFPEVPITYDADYKDINPETVAITGNDHLLIYRNSILQFTVNNIRSEYFTYIDTVRVTINNRNFTGTTTYTTDQTGITTQDTPIVINYGAVDFEGTKTLTFTVTDLEGNAWTKSYDVSVIQRPKIQNVTYTFDNKPYYMKSTMKVDSWFGATQKALVRCRLYWTGDNGITYDYTISDIMNSETADSNISWIKISPVKWTAMTPSDVPLVTQNTEFEVTIDLTEATGDYSGISEYQWIIDKGISNGFDNFNFEWSIESETGADTKTYSNLSTESNYQFFVVEGVEVDGVVEQVVKECDFDLMRFLNPQLIQRSKDIRRLYLVKNN